MEQEELARVSLIATQTLRFYKQSGSRVLVDVETLVESVLALYRSRFANVGITASSDCKRASPFRCFDGKIHQIFVNPVANAFDAMKSGGTLTIRCRDTILFSGSRPELRITIADTGTGMDSSTLRRLFEPFFTTKGIGGTGLGMWITQDLVNNKRRTGSCAKQCQTAEARNCVRTDVSPLRRVGNSTKLLVGCSVQQRSLRTPFQVATCQSGG